MSELRLAGLAEPDAAELLASVAAGPVQPDVARQIAVATGGNPLATLEIGARLTTVQLAGRAPLPHQLPVGRQIEEQFIGQVRALPDHTQTLLLTAAADTTGDPALVLRAGRTLGFDRTSVSPAEDADMIVLEPRISFRHPLIRSAVYDLAGDADRRRVHQALADVTDATADPDRRAWHRAVAASGFDEDVADELERAAGRAGRRGGRAAAASFLTRAAQLSGDPATRASRLLAVAEEEIAAGNPARPDVARPGAARARVAARARARPGDPGRGAHLARPAGEGSGHAPRSRRVAASLRPGRGAVDGARDDASRGVRRALRDRRRHHRRRACGPRDAAAAGHRPVGRRSAARRARGVERR